jgi:hypothetical protein
MIKLLDLITEKSPCWKGYKQIGMKEKDGREVPNCVPIEEGQYDDTSKFNLVKQNPFDIKKLVDKGIIFVTKPGNGQGGVEEPNWEGDASVITLYNMANAEPWMEEAVKTPLPQAIPYIQNDQDKLLYDGKYNQILWGIEKKGLKSEDFYLNANDEIDEYDVENEQDLKEFVTFIKEYKQVLSEGCGCLTEAEYHGHKVTLGKIMQGDIKKFKVYVKNNKGKVVKVNFGFGGKSAHGKRMVIKAKNPKRRAAYRARHNCDNPGPRWKANYWSCKKW